MPKTAVRTVGIALTIEIALYNHPAIVKDYFVRSTNDKEKRKKKRGGSTIGGFLFIKREADEVDKGNP